MSAAALDDTGRPPCSGLSAGRGLCLGASALRTCRHTGIILRNPIRTFHGAAADALPRSVRGPAVLLGGGGGGANGSPPCSSSAPVGMSRPPRKILLALVASVVGDPDDDSRGGRPKSKSLVAAAAAVAVVLVVQRAEKSSSGYMSMKDEDELDDLELPREWPRCRGELMLLVAASMSAS